MKEEQRTYLFGLLEKQFGKMSARERLIAGSIIDEAVNLATKELQAQIEKMKCCGNCRFSENDKLNGTFCHREGCFVVASAKCKLWEN